MTLLWNDVRLELEARVQQFEAIWALIWHAQGGVLILSMVEPLDRGLQLTATAEHLGQALDELERVRPELQFLCLPGEPGPVPVDEVNDYRAGIDLLLQAAGNELTRVLREESEDLDLGELAALASVSSLLGESRQLLNEPLR